MITLAAFIRHAITTLEQNHIDNAAQDGRLLAQWASATSALDAIRDPQQKLSEEAFNRLESVLNRRLKGEPVFRILGEREFYGRSFKLSPETLEPRDDSEALIDIVLPFLKQKVQKKQPLPILDMGTGTGIIAITLLAEIKHLHATAVDISSNALKTATFNAKHLGVQKRFQPLLSDWFQNVSGRYALIISNPPYIAQKELATLSREVREHDPLRALDGGEDGLDFYRALSVQALSFLDHDGLIAVEIGQGQADDVIALFTVQNFTHLETRKDLSNIDRALLFQQKSG